VAQPQRVAVFLDWQNVYKRARAAFHGPRDPYVNGQVHPLDLGLTLAERGPADIARELAFVRVYRGMPDQALDPFGYAAARRQHARWCRDARVILTTRRLRYPDGWTSDARDVGDPREKGIDVALAIDFVTMGIDGQFDVGVVMSSDQDLLPALEYLRRRSQTRGGFPVIEVAAWRSEQTRSMRLSLGNNKPFCHWLDKQTYWGLQDSR
jgi:hypothetical protein